MASFRRTLVLSVCAAVLCLAASSTAAAPPEGPRRSLRVAIDAVSANALPVTEGLPKGADTTSPDLPDSHPRLAARAGVAQCQPEQVHLTYWTSTSVLVSFASCAAELNKTRARSTAGVRSVVFWGASPDRLDSRAEGVATSYAVDYTTIPRGISYASPLLHHVLLTGLTPGATIHYAPATNAGGGSSSDLSRASKGARVYKFTLPKPGSFPVKVGIIGDPGQTVATAATLDRLIASSPDLVLVAGDFSYADRWASQSEYVLASEEVTFQPKWDTFGRLFEPLLSEKPMMHTDGNHEIEQTNGERQAAYNARYPTPYAAGHNTSRGPSSFVAASGKPGRDPFANLYYSVELPGAFKFISLTSYAAGQTFDPQEPQYRWLKAELAKVDRQRTPWVIVSLHGPFYHTFTSHWKELECMRQAYEPLIVAGGVDVFVSGHTHAYERIKPLVDYKLSACGPQYLVVGDGGNVEGLAHEFVDSKQPELCRDPRGHAAKIFPPRYQPQACYSYQAGAFCPTKQPEWSAHRTAGFGFGSLELLSATQARFSWTHVPGATKGDQGSWRVADSVVLTRNDSRRGCPKISDLP